MKVQTITASTLRDLSSKDLAIMYAGCECVSDIKPGAGVILGYKGTSGSILVGYVNRLRGWGWSTGQLEDGVLTTAIPSDLKSFWWIPAYSISLRTVPLAVPVSEELYPFF